MKRFIVENLEVYTVCYQVMAETEEEAIEKVKMDDVVKETEHYYHSLLSSYGVEATPVAYEDLP